MSDSTTTQPKQRVQTHKYDACAVCGQPVETVIETVLGGSVENNAETKQAKTCYEPVDTDTGQPARVRLFFHRPGDLDATTDEAKLDQAVNRNE